MIDVDIAIVGGGVSGLSAAYEIGKRKRTVALLEQSAKPGGIVQTEHFGEFVIDAGPDALLVQKPAAVALCNEIGLGERLVPTKTPRTAYILRNGTLHPIAGASVLGFPTRIRPLLQSTLFSLSGKARMGAELLIPRRRGQSDESIASFVRRRFGDEAVTYVAEPLLAGIHAGEVERLSMRALFPRFVEAEARSRSVIRSFRGMRAAPNTQGAFRSFPGGIGELIDALMRVVPRDSVRLSSTVTRIIPVGTTFTVHAGNQPPINAHAVLMACPAYVAADLLQPFDRELAGLCGSIEYLSTATVAMAFPREAIRHTLSGSGFVVPRTEGLHITAGAWISSKWPQRAPEGQTLLRAFLGGARDPNVLAKSDRELAEIALREMSQILGIQGLPGFTKVYRWHRSSPQLQVGHLDLMAKIDARLTSHPGLFVSSAGFRGVGIPDCVSDARATAEHAVDYVRHQ